MSLPGNLRFFNNEDIYDLRVRIDGKKYLNVHRIILSNCDKIKTQFHNKPNWRIEGEDILDVKTNDFIRTNHYVTFFKAAYVHPDFESIRSELEDCVLQIHFLCQYYAYGKLEEYICELIIQMMCIGAIRGLINHFFNVIPEECSKATASVRKAIIIFLGFTIKSLQKNEDLLRDVLSLTNFELFREIALSDSTQLTYQSRIELLKDYLLVHFGIREKEGIRTCELIDTYSEKQKILKLWHDIEKKFFLDESKYHIHPIYGIAIYRCARFAPVTAEFGAVRSRAVCVNQNDIVIERGGYIRLSLDCLKTMRLNSRKSTSYDFAQCKVVIPIPDITSFCSGEEIRYTKCFIINLMLNLSICNNQVILDYHVKCDEYASVSIKCVLKCLLYFLGDSLVINPNEEIAFDTEQPRRKLVSGIKLNSDNLIKRDSYEECRDGEMILPFKFILNVTEIKTHH